MSNDVILINIYPVASHIDCNYFHTTGGHYDINS